MSNQGLITLRQLFAACHNFVDLLDLPAVLALALVSREVWNLARGFIEQRYWFRVYLDEQRFGGSEAIRFRHYGPRSLTLTNIDDEDAPVFVVPESVVSLQMIFAKRAFENKNPVGLVERYIGATHLRLTELTFSHGLNSPVDHLPPRVTHLTLGDRFNQPVEHLPASLTHLSFGSRFNQPVDHLPASLTYLSLGGRFNQPVDRLPPRLTHLCFEREFNQSVDRLPPGVTHLMLGCGFNQRVEHLPPNLTHVSFGRGFNQPVEHLPRGVTHLSFWYGFNQPVNSLPARLTHLVLGRDFNQPLEHLPSRLTNLGLCHLFDGSLEQLPEGLELLAFLEEHDPSFVDYRYVPYYWAPVETRPNVLWLESGQVLTAEQLAEPSLATVYRWKKPVPPPPKRNREEDNGEQSAKRT